VKAMILAAGLGARMRPLTEHTPKPLLRAGGQALIDFHLHKLAAAGIREVVVNCSWLADQLEDYLADGSRYGLSIQLSRETQPLETAGGIVQALPYLDSEEDEPFLVINGDIWTEFDFAALRDIKPVEGHLVLIENPPHNPGGDFYLNQSALISEKAEGLRYTFSGISVWRPSVFRDFDSASRAFKPVMLAAIARDALGGELYQGRWWDIGTPQRLADLDAFLRVKSE
jgi:MurNAc alpha-1-phosphate uridylyltransferase